MEAGIEVLTAVPQNVRRLMTPMVALAHHFESAHGDSTQQSFKLASAVCRSSCACCILRNRKGCCSGRSQLERAAAHGCLFCTRWLLLGFGSARALQSAQGVAATDEVLALLSTASEASAHCAATSTMEGQIPKCIHQIWIGPRTRPVAWMDTWRVDYLQAHPHWSYRLWHDADVEGILPRSLRKMYEVLPHWCIKSDLLRYALLQQHGGVYIDADTSWLGTHGLDCLLDAREFVMALENEPVRGYGSDERIANSFIGLPPNHRLMTTLIDKIAADVVALRDYFGERTAYLSDFRVCHRLTGPAALSQVFHSLGLREEQLVPPDRLYPLPWWKAQSLAMSVEATRRNFPNAVITHYGYSTNRMGGEEPSAVQAVG